MWRSFRLLAAAAQPSVADYIEHLQRADKELPSLHDIFPKSNNSEDAVKFHSTLCAVMEDNGFPLVGIKVLPPSCEALAALRGSRPICVPIFANLLQPSPASIKKDRLQYVEATICLEVERLQEDCATVDGAMTNSVALAPCIEVSGSRFPFYPPTLVALACDLGGCVKISKGPDTALRGEKAAVGNHRFVLTHNEEPVQVGSGKRCLDSPFSAVAVAAVYAKAIKAPRDRNMFVFCGGVCPRTPVQAGQYSFEWGRFGRLTCTVLP